MRIAAVTSNFYVLFVLVRQGCVLPEPESDPNPVPAHNSLSLLPRRTIGLMLSQNRSWYATCRLRHSRRSWGHNTNVSAVEKGNANNSLSWGHNTNVSAPPRLIWRVLFHNPSVSIRNGLSSFVMDEWISNFTFVFGWIRVGKCFRSGGIKSLKSLVLDTFSWFYTY